MGGRRRIVAVAALEIGVEHLRCDFEQRVLDLFVGWRRLESLPHGHRDRVETLQLLVERVLVVEFTEATHSSTELVVAQENPVFEWFRVTHPVQRELLQ